MAEEFQLITFWVWEYRTFFGSHLKVDTKPGKKYTNTSALSSEP